jgi:hypothetical protein
MLLIQTCLLEVAIVWRRRERPLSLEMLVARSRAPFLLDRMSTKVDESSPTLSSPVSGQEQAGQEGESCKKDQDWKDRRDKA